jgi:ABC-2 type transport system permease protein
MTTLATNRPGRPVRGARVLLRACAAEWSRLWTVRATWWFGAVTAVIMVGIAATAGRSAATQPDPPVGDAAWAVAEVVLLPAQFALLAMALMAVTSDDATGGIVPTLQATPRRGVLFLARALVAAGTATGLGVLLATAASLLGWATARPVLTLPADRGVDVLSTVAFVLAAGTLLAVGLGFLLRSTAGVLVSVFLLLLVLPGLLPQLGDDWLTDVADLLPGTGAIFLLTEEPRGRGLTDTSAGATMLVWAAAALLLGWVRLLRDDATR